jgi:hypothetical protein
VPYHYWSVIGEESPVSEVVGCCPPPFWNGRGARSASGGSIFYRGAGAEVMNELVAKFQRWEELCSRLDGPGARICDMLLGPPPSQARWADRLV